MGNSCGVSAVNHIVTLGGVRKSENGRRKPLTVKTNGAKDAKPAKSRVEKQHKLQNNDKPPADKEKQCKNVVKTSSPIAVENQRVVCADSNENATLNSITSKKNCKALSRTESKNGSNETFKPQQDHASNTCSPRNDQKKLQNQQKLFRGESNLSSDFNCSVASSHPNLFLSSKHLMSEKFRTEWQREEKRLQLEYIRAERQIKNFQQDELRAKRETQSWREKLEMLSLEHRKRLFKQAQSLHSRLHNAEKLLTYHEIRAKKLQMKNDTMKELINSVKEEAKNLRIESEKRREITHKIFDEKFSTVEKQLTKLKQRIGDSNVQNTSELSLTAIGSSPNRFTQGYEYEGLNHTNKKRNTTGSSIYPYNYSRYFQFFKDKCHQDPELNSKQLRALDTRLLSSVNSISPKASNKCDFEFDNRNKQPNTNRYKWKSQQNKMSSPSKFSITKHGQDYEDKLLHSRNTNSNTSESKQTRSGVRSLCSTNSSKARTSRESRFTTRAEIHSTATTSSTDTGVSNPDKSFRSCSTSKYSDFEGAFPSSPGSSVLMRLFQRDSPSSAASSMTPQSVKFFNH